MIANEDHGESQEVAATMTKGCTERRNYSQRRKNLTDRDGHRSRAVETASVEIPSIVERAFDVAGHFYKVR